MRVLEINGAAWVSSEDETPLKHPPIKHPPAPTEPKQKGPEISLQPLCYVNLPSLTSRGRRLCRPIQYLRRRP